VFVLCGKAGGGELHKGTCMPSRPSFYTLHRNLQVFGVSLTLVGAVCAYVGVEQVWGSGGDAHGCVLLNDYKKRFKRTFICSHANFAVCAQYLCGLSFQV
jgi:hypothetical protein